MNGRFLAIAAAALTLLAACLSIARAEPYVWGFQAEQLEYRAGTGDDVAAWDFDAFFGKDELRLVWRSEAEYETGEKNFESLQNQLRLQKPISDFFDAVAGVSVETPDGYKRVHGVLGLHGLAPQWFEIDADLFVSDRPYFRFEAEYEGLITNRLILTPSVEVEVPLVDDRFAGRGAWGPKVEIGARLSYDLVDRAFSPYVGVHYERSFGETANLKRAEGGDADSLFLVVGARLMF
ncbi:copper resistance protein B [Oceanibacterium hippocampi]|uniref:Copper resistance protein B n=1 Tax=Oceanibacterium hippocampi TaxID=745714 RepID=A0A1Y5TLI4_9PROT|nr:copper resistance protein B [Oceanibacterium hippocampi]SLN63039.1 Copper resistance protein B precursor [Oceanibacterium hippocampi]